MCIRDSFKCYQKGICLNIDIYVDLDVDLDDRYAFFDILVMCQIQQNPRRPVLLKVILQWIDTWI